MAVPCRCERFPPIPVRAARGGQLIRRDLTAEGAEGAEKMAMQSLKIGDRVRVREGRPMPLIAWLRGDRRELVGRVVAVVVRTPPAQPLVDVRWDERARGTFRHWAWELRPADELEAEAK